MTDSTPTSILDDFVRELDGRAKGRIRGTARVEIVGEGSVMLDETGARAGEGEADVALIAKAEVFRGILDGTQNPIMAVMGRKLKVEGNPQRALKVSDILTGA